METRERSLGGGAVGQMIAEADWAASPLGPIEKWPAPLIGAVRVMLPARAEIVLFWGPEYVALYNDAFAPTIGDKHPQALGRPAVENWRELWSDLEPLLGSVRATGETVFAKDRPFYIERRGYGEEVFFDISYSPIQDEDGAVGGVFCIVAETTERVRAQRRSAEERERLAHMFDQAPSFMALLSEPGHVFELANPAFQRMIGGREVIGQTPREALPEFVGQIYLELLDKVAATGEGFTGRGMTMGLKRSVNGPIEDRQADFVFQPIKDSRGQVTGIFIEGADVTERFQAEARLRANEAKLRELNETLERRVDERTRERDRTWNNSQDLLLIVGADGRFRSINPAWTKTLGWSPQEVIGKDHLEFIHPDDHTKSLRALHHASRESLDHFEHRYRHKDGSYRWISWLSVPEGDLIYANGRDITQEREQAAALATAEEALRQSQKMEAVGQLTGGLAHDFNNLLTGIGGSLELLQARLSQGRFGDADRFISTAQDASRRAASLTHRLLAFSRRQTLDPRPTDVNRLVAGMEELIRRTVGPSIATEVVGAPGLWPTFVDAHQLENALLNLCINARDAMPDGGRLTIETANKWLDERTARDRDLPPGQYISLCVTDTGIGMTPEVIERAFDPFFTTKPMGQGTGLGLSMIYGFARQSGGQVRIYSEVGQGTSMCVYLPRHNGTVGEREIAHPKSESPHAANGHTVLVVDDEPSIRMLIADLLEEIGYTVIEAEDGQAGLDALRSSARIDLLVTDVGLPGGMNGRQLADLGRLSRPGVKILFITGYAENAVMGNFNLEPGMQVLTKPFVMKALANLIESMIFDA